MFVRSLTLLVLLAITASAEYETTLTQGRSEARGGRWSVTEKKCKCDFSQSSSPQMVKLYKRGPYNVPDGKCSARLDLSEECRGLREEGIRKLGATVKDSAAYPNLVFSKRKNDDHKIDTITVKREQPCKGLAVLNIKIECESKGRRPIFPPQDDTIHFVDDSIAPMSKPLP